jgi:geranylgeranyl diphosphate synthase, type I
MYTAAAMTTVSSDIDLSILLADTEAELVRLVADRDPSTHGLYEMVRYHLALDGAGANGGKRMRPLLGLLAYTSIAGDHHRALPGAAAVELGHNFSLVHDDIEDGDLERRHRPTLWAVHGVPQAINTGDTLFSLSRIALHRLTDLGFSDAKVLRLMRLYDETCLALCEGQYLDIAMSASDSLGTVDGYFDMIGRKTASLIAASIEAGALLATDDDDVIGRYRGFGWALGLAFQLNDDLLGIWGAERSTGKEPSDLAHRKKTLPVIYAHEAASPADRSRLAELIAATDVGGAQVAEIVGILERTGAREYTRDQAHRYRDAALGELDAAGVVTPAARERLEQIIVSVISA